MPEFKVIIETDKSHVFKFVTETPELAVKTALSNFLDNYDRHEVNELIVLDPEDEMGFGMPILQYNNEPLKELIKVTNGI